MSTMELDGTHEQFDAHVAEHSLRAAAAATAGGSSSLDAAGPVDPALRTYRGRTLEELLPKIRAELGPDAIVVRQRDGLMGGIGGFFQQQFVEIEARAGHPRIDVYDEPPEPAGEGFAALLAAAEESAEEPSIEALLASADPEPVAEPAPTPTLAPTPSPSLDPVAALQAAGMSEAFATRLVADARAHELPFVSTGDLRAATVRAVARCIPVPLPRRAGAGLAFAFAGTGSTRCADALAKAYTQAGAKARTVATVEQARTRVKRGSADALVVLDVPPVAPDDAEQVAQLAAQLATLGLDETLLVLPASTSLDEALALHARLAPLAPSGIAIAAAGPADRLGAAVELACTTRLPLAYVLDAAGAIAPADPVAIAERLLP